MIRVLVNALSATTGGGATYAVEQLSALGKERGMALTVHAVGDAAAALRVRAPEIEVVEHPVRSLGRRILWEQFVLPAAHRRHDVLYSLGNFATFLWPKPQVVAFQSPHHFGNGARTWLSLHGEPRHRMRIRIERVAARASFIRASVPIAISQSLRTAMLEDLGERRIPVILSATPQLPAPRQPEHRSPPPEYMLTVANDYPHKDWDGLIEQFLGDVTLPPLVVIGRPRSAVRAEALARRVDSAPGRVVLWGSEPDRAALAWLYGNASAYVAHSFLEAFPLTPYEALSHGTPVVASDIPSHREVCDADVTYYPADDPSQMAAKLLQAAQGPRVQSTLAASSWADNARALATLLREAGAGS